MLTSSLADLAGLLREVLSCRSSRSNPHDAHPPCASGLPGHVLHMLMVEAEDFSRSRLKTESPSLPSICLNRSCG